MTHKSETKDARGAHALPRTKGHRWPLDVRLGLARAVVDQQVRGSQAAQQPGVPYTTALEWVKRYREGGARALESMVRAAAGKCGERGDALRAAITPAGRGQGARSRASAAEPPTPKPVAMSRARRLKRVFGIDIEQRCGCGGRLRVIASIEEPALIERILAHRQEGSEGEQSCSALGPRAPPQPSLL